MFYFQRDKVKAIRKKLVDPFERLREPGENGIVCQWVRDAPADDEVCAWPIVDMVRYANLISLLPDKIVTNLEKGRLAHDGRYPMLKAGLGYSELLAPIITDATAIASSSAEAKLAPTMRIPSNYMAPQGLPGRTLRMTLRGRVTTLTTAATMTFRNRIAATDIITGTILHATGAIVQDATVQTNTMWTWKGEVVTRSVGSGGTVFAMGDSDIATAALTIAQQTNRFSGSAGSATPAAAAWDTSADQFFQITAQWSLATAYSIQCHHYLLEALN